MAVNGRQRRPAPWLASLLAATCWHVSGSLLAAQVPGFDEAVDMMAREQPVERFLEDLFGQIDVPVVVDEAVRGSVNGDFSKTAQGVFDDIRASFQLTLYYDGGVAHVYRARDTAREILYVPASVGRKVMSSAGKLKLLDDSNRLATSEVGLVATGTKRFLEQIQELSNAIQSSAATFVSPETYRVFKLKYGWADDLTLVVGGQEVSIPGVASVLRSLTGSGGFMAPDGTQRSSLDRTQPRLGGTGLQSAGESPTPDSRQTAPMGSRAGTSASQPSAVGSSERTRIVADPLNNAVVVRDRADRMAGYAALIDSLDTEPMMIEIEATIIDMDTDRLRELGVNWRAQRDNDEILLGSGSAADTLLQANAPPAAIGEGGVISLVLGDSTRFISRIQALETQGAARIVSKPHVITLANVEALLDNTETFFVRVEGQEEVDLFNVSVGTTLRVTPHVFEAGGRTRIKLLVNIEDGSTSDQRVDEIPIIARSSINTQALINEGQSLLIGGLVRETVQNGVSKVPLLGDIPGLGALFRTNRKTSAQAERLFLITPRLVANSGSPDGGRFDGPIMSGTEETIIRSAPSRMETTRAGLNARDERYPLPKALPAGTGTPGLTTSEAARSPSEGNSRGRPTTLQERLQAFHSRGQHVPSVNRATFDGSASAPIVDARGEATSATIHPPVEFVRAPDTDDGWVAVPGSKPAASSGPTPAGSRQAR